MKDASNSKLNKKYLGNKNNLRLYGTEHKTALAKNLNILLMSS